MFCWKCGTENPEDARFCKKCGATFEKAPETNGSNPEREDAVGQFLGKKIVQLKNVFANKKKIIIVSAAIAAVVIVVIAGVSSSTKKGSKADINRAISSEAGTSTASAENVNNSKNTVSVEDIKNAKVGDIIKFGSYEQDNNSSNGAEPIEWQVVDFRNGYTVLLSKNVLDCKHYNEKTKDITWENSTLRSWLNNDFYNTAFSSSEKKKIATAHNQNPDSYEIYKSLNKSYTMGAKGGNITDDKVFLLSWTEVRDYFGGKIENIDLGIEDNYNQKLLCKPTAYAQAQGVDPFENSNNALPSDTVGCCWWWLRSPGEWQYHAMGVNFYGCLSEYDDGYPLCRGSGVRPAILIDSENDNGNNTQSSTEKTQSNNKDSTNQVNWLHRDPAYDLFGDSTAR